MRFQDSHIEDPRVEDTHAAAPSARFAGDAVGDVVSLTAALIAVGGMMLLQMGLVVTLVQNVSMALAVAA